MNKEAFAELGFEFEETEDGPIASNGYESAHEAAQALISVKLALLARNFTVESEEVHGDDVVCVFESDEETVVVTQHVGEMAVSVEL